MEKKSIQRVIGIVVVIALVIAIIPLFFMGGNESPTQAAIKTPPFPEPAETTTTAQANDTPQAPATGVAPQPSINNPAPGKEAAAATPAGATEVAANAGNTTETAATTSSATTDTSEVNTSSMDQPLVPVADQLMQSLPKPEVPTNNQATEAKQEAPAAVPVNDTKVSAQEEKPKQKIKHKKVKSIAKKATTSHKNLNQQNLTQLKSPAWVIQLGSFKSKSNAEQLANKLRKQGYKAFIHETKSSKRGQNTARVYVGPEFKKFTALTLANKIEREMNMHGIIVSYNPLEL